MTELQFNEIKDKLRIWREKRDLSYIKQLQGYIGNIFEELSEYYRSNSDLERVDALCDICVFTLNSFRLDYKPYIFESTKFNFSELLKNISNIESDIKEFNKSLESIKSSKFSEKEKIKQTLDLEFYFKNIFIDSALIIINMCFDKLKEMGYHSYVCMYETVSEIESRTGYYDINIQKFVKHKGAYNKDDAFNKFLKENKDSDFYVIENNNEFVILNKKDNSELSKYVKWYKADYSLAKLH